MGAPLDDRIKLIYTIMLDCNLISDLPAFNLYLETMRRATDQSGSITKLDRKVIEILVKELREGV